MDKGLSLSVKKGKEDKSDITAGSSSSYIEISNAPGVSRNSVKEYAASENILAMAHKKQIHILCLELLELLLF